MHNKIVEQAHHSIHHVHELIHTLFTDANGNGQAALEPLMSAFAEHFTMVTTSAAIVSRATIEQMFRGAVGAKPGLEIVISDLQTVWQEGHSVAIRYKETHRLDQRESSRVSVAIIGLHHRNAQWIYLHETPLSQES
ncbi:DUF4440 domain-containing protein [Pseudomonas sp. RTC3]|uniref:DUF4440 domain-containing protein n=1 Tax=unclassified Pseudomonas TaxID=196821 RepID=UPI002AB46FB5|nr:MULTISPECIES: DUF4440 domain-containing protein [unclassified Pseudomonas]MEB0062025.1 DUF4440 domain-containing protein [Pseudomonas sp. RTC3]MDY7567254.1 DUF4440 domain-containing protein [Pseudomonas sp. 5C2]MEB0005413.1 DUF4440 domain-containing protein [Pseudomonas sp. RTB2]MEB0016603.1 DUF4440 domain-containing protein [Pseudomonas sp. RTB3]MEB0027060.1 DUF4440 domain-containing protein [Pseudomonas sp. MH9.2]